jgi:hypothetical protein
MGADRRHRDVGDSHLHIQQPVTWAGKPDLLLQAPEGLVLVVVLVVGLDGQHALDELLRSRGTLTRSSRSSGVG